MLINRIFVQDFLFKFILFNSLLAMNNLPPKKTQGVLKDWKFQFQEGNLSPSTEIEKIEEQCKLFRAPTIVFGNNYCHIVQTKHKIGLIYNAQEALRFINFQTRKEKYRSVQQYFEKVQPNTISYIPQRLKIQYAKKWETIEKPQDIQICQIQQSSDCFFITPFKGHIDCGDNSKIKIERTKNSVIPVQKLGPENPIKFYSQGSIYQDELDDNGLIQYEYKFRSMQNAWFGLIRCYVRVDQVIIMILDTRIYWQQGWNKIARQFMVKKNTWEQLKHKGFEFQPGWSINPNQSHLIYQHLDQVFTENQYIHYG